MIYYISDTHFNDQKIFDKCKRPFESLCKMNEIIIKKWNKKVKDEDIVYVLGDIGKDDDPSIIDIFKKLKGHKHLIVGNHDESFISFIKKSNIFETIKYIDLIIDNGVKVCICHYPLLDWSEFNRGSYLVYGHIHNKTIKNGKEYQQIKEYYSDKNAYNCGIDVVGYVPVTLKEMIELKEKNKDEAYIN